MVWVSFRETRGSFQDLNILWKMTRVNLCLLLVVKNDGGGGGGANTISLQTTGEATKQMYQCSPFSCRQDNCRPPLFTSICHLCAVVGPWNWKLWLVNIWKKILNFRKILYKEFWRPHKFCKDGSAADIWDKNQKFKMHQHKRWVQTCRFCLH